MRVLVVNAEGSSVGDGVNCAQKRVDCRERP